MKISKISRERNDWHFWQILVICSGAEFIKFGETFIQSLELNSPDTRLVVLITDNHLEARKKLTELARELLSVAVYEARTETTHECERYNHVASILEMTKLPILLVRVDSLIRRDISLIPAELQKCDCAIPLRLERQRRAEKVRVSTLWLSANHSSQSLLREVTAYLRTNASSKITEDLERKAVYTGLSRCRDFVRTAPMPGKYCDRKDTIKSYILSDLSNRKLSSTLKSEIDAIRSKFLVPITHVIIYPKQDLGTKASLKNNHFKIRASRLSRPGRIYWRFMSRLLAEMARKEGGNARIVAIPQWEIDLTELKNYDAVDVIYLPHLIRAQLDHPKAQYYMQELLPNIFTVDRDGWGAASNVFARSDFLHHEIDERINQFLTKIRGTKTTKAPQKKAESGILPSFDILVPLQVPGDDALVNHADISLEEFARTMAEFAERTQTKVMFRKHPYDETSFYNTIEGKYSSKNVIFDSRGHIHDVLNLAPAVAVINSGVGFEAMIYNKPLLTFGRAVYDVAATKVTPSNIDEAYHSISKENPKEREERYLKFISWYVFKIAFKIDEKILNQASDRLGHSVNDRNPIFDDLRCDEKAETRGIKIKKLPSTERLQRFRAKTSHVFRHWDRARTRTWQRFQKTYVRKLNELVKLLFLKRLDDKHFDGKRVALVGNASSLQRGQMGAEIDNHDIVIRMNLGYPLTVKSSLDADDIPNEWISERFVDQKSTGRETLTLLRPDTPHDVATELTHVIATGRKTDIWSCSTSDRSRQLKYAPVFDCVKVACHPAYWHLSWKLLIRHSVMRMKRSVFDKLSNNLVIEPTSGLIWIEYLSKTNLASLNLYGFDFFATGHIARTTPNVLQAGGKWPHDPLAEKNYALEIIANDARVTLKNSD